MLRDRCKQTPPGDRRAVEATVGSAVGGKVGRGGDRRAAPSRGSLTSAAASILAGGGASPARAARRAPDHATARVEGGPVVFGPGGAAPRRAAAQVWPPPLGPPRPDPRARGHAQR